MHSEAVGGCSGTSRLTAVYITHGANDNDCVDRRLEVLISSMRLLEKRM